MSKQITSNELAEIVTGLLLNPQLMGELDELDSYCSFMEAIGQVVADHCGGTINMVHPPGGDTLLTTHHDTPVLSVSYNESIPSPHANVWASYDFTGWEDVLDSHGKTIKEPSDYQQKKAHNHRQKLQWLLINSRNLSGDDFEPVPGMEANELSIVLAGLRHLQKSIENEDSLMYLNDIVDAGTVNADDIDELCEKINIKT